MGFTGVGGGSAEAATGDKLAARAAAEAFPMNSLLCMTNPRLIVELKPHAWQTCADTNSKITESIHLG